MRPNKFRPLLTLLTISGLLLSAASPLQARPIKFPKEEPTFSVSLPEGWTSKTDKDGNLDCDPGDDSGYAFAIILLPGITTKADLKKSLPDLAKKMAQGAKIKDLALGEIETSKNDNDVSFIGLAASGTAQDLDIQMVLHGFEPQKGKFYIIMTFGTEKADKAHEQDYNSIFDSIKPLAE